MSVASSGRLCRSSRCPSPPFRSRGSDRLFPVHRIYCVGRNYAEHAVEMGHDPTRDPPFFFQKNPDNLLVPGQDFPYPSGTRTCISRSRWWWRSARAGRTCRSMRPWTWSMAMLSAST